MTPKATLLPWLGGAPAIRRTATHMRRLVDRYRRDPAIVETARRVLTAYGVPRDDSEAEARAFYDFLRRHVRYTKDPVDVELLQDPRVTLAWKTGDCDDIAILAASLAESVGRPSRFLLYSGPGRPLPHHVLAQVKTGKGWTSLDTVWDRGAGETPPGKLELGGLPMTGVASAGTMGQVAPTTTNSWAWLKDLGKTVLQTGVEYGISRLRAQTTIQQAKATTEAAAAAAAAEAAAPKPPLVQQLMPVVLVGGGIGLLGLVLLLRARRS